MCGRFSESRQGNLFYYTLVEIIMGNSSTKLAERCSLLSRDEVPVVASSFKFVSKNSERIKEDDLMVSIFKINECQVRCQMIHGHGLFSFSCSPPPVRVFFHSYAPGMRVHMTEILGVTNGSTAGSIHNEFFVWHAGEPIDGR